MTKPSLAARRKELIERCAEQRTGLAYELRALRPANALASHPVVGYLAGHKKLVLGALGACFGLVAVRRKRLPGVGHATGWLIQPWTIARTAMGLLARYRS